MMVHCELPQPNTSISGTGSYLYGIIHEWET